MPDGDDRDRLEFIRERRRDAHLTDDGPPVAPTQLRCIECGAISPTDARDWHAYLTVDGLAATYCSNCSRKEFGDA
jgi:hypothetical protein